MNLSLNATGLFGLLREAMNQDPDAPFLIEPDRSITYGEAHESARALAAWWKTQGIGRGDRVVLCCQNRAEIAIGVFAAALLGAIFVVLNARLRPHGLAKILSQATPKAAIADEETLALFPDLPLPAARLLITSGEAPADWTNWKEAMLSDPLDENHWPGIDVDPVSLVFTSGSTADPRGVTLSHDNIVFVTAAIQERLGYRPDDIIGCFLPLAFDYGLYQVFLAARAGAALFIGDPAMVGPRLPRILAETEVSVLPAVPAITAALIALHERRPFSLPRLRAVTNTGERLPLAYIERLETMFPDLAVFPMYGLTECKRVSILLPSERITRPESVGRPLAGTEVYAVDENGTRLPPGEAGELVVRGRHVGHGYWQAPEETARRYRKPGPECAVELFTGDRGSVDAEGYLYFAARTDDLMKHRGNRISPVEIEAETCGVPGVIEAALLKRASDDTLHLFVTLSNPELSEHAILDCLREKLEPFKVPEFVRIESSLPKSLNGKIDRKALQSRIDHPATDAPHESLAEATRR